MLTATTAQQLRASYRGLLAWERIQIQNSKYGFCCLHIAFTPSESRKILTPTIQSVIAVSKSMAGHCGWHLFLEERRPRQPALRAASEEGTFCVQGGLSPPPHLQPRSQTNLDSRPAPATCKACDLGQVSPLETVF